MKDFIDFLKLPPSILSALSIASGVLLFLPEELIKKLYMIEFREKYGFTIGIIFIISTSLLIIFLLTKIFHHFKDKIDSKKLGEYQTRYLNEASPEIVAVIREFLHEPTHTIYLPVNDGLVIELQHFQLITPAGQNHLVDMTNPAIKFFLQPWVVRKINADQTLKEKFY